jgi:hypothetical protein
MITSGRGIARRICGDRSMILGTGLARCGALKEIAGRQPTSCDFRQIARPAAWRVTGWLPETPVACAPENVTGRRTLLIW